MSTSQEPRRGRGRPRTPGAEERIIEAALEEYGEHGWSGFTMDGVARRANVGKSTVYLRWQDKDTLLTDAVSSASLSLAAADGAWLAAGSLVVSLLELLQAARTSADAAMPTSTADVRRLMGLLLVDRGPSDRTSCLPRLSSSVQEMKSHSGARV